MLIDEAVLALQSHFDTLGALVTWLRTRAQGTPHSVTWQMEGPFSTIKSPNWRALLDKFLRAVFDGSDHSNALDVKIEADAYKIRSK